MSRSQFVGNTHMLGTPALADFSVRSASAIVLDASDMSITASTFEQNLGGDVISLSWVKEPTLALVAKKIKFCRSYKPMT